MDDMIQVPRALLREVLSNSLDSSSSLRPRIADLLSQTESDHEQVSPVDGTTWVQRNNGWQHIDVLDRVIRMRRSDFHGLMIGVDGHWAYIGDEEEQMRGYLMQSSRSK